MRSQAVAAILAGFAIASAPSAWARASHHEMFDADVTGTDNQEAVFGPAELDPAFQQKLLQRSRGRYEHAHPLDLNKS
ncbi:MAG: hypothetical protein WCD52_06205 [Xanthobacteraceae bacterium]